MQEKAPLLSVADALDFLLNAVKPLTAQSLIATEHANGRVLATAQVADIDVPGMDNSQMDGYAVRAADCLRGSARLPVSQRILAGQQALPLAAGSAARIFTGAPMPLGADAVVMQEACVADETHVSIQQIPQAGEWVRRRGEDIGTGDVLLAAGTRLRAQELGLAASVGLAQLPVVSRPRVAVFFTGDELVMPGEALRPGTIYNSNRFLLRGLLENLGCEITDYGIVEDNLESTRATLRRAAQEHDVIITSGGVSVGDADHVKPAVQAEGRLNLWQIAMKPGKPLAFGEVDRATGGFAWFFGLPGNPVSSFVTFLILVRPFLLRLQGVTDVAPHRYPLRADFTWAKPDRRQEFLRARLNADGGLDLFPQQGSAVLTSTVWGDGLIDNPPGHAIAQGDTVGFIPFSELR
ncbi:molybdopterin molybdotransferase MoeA [Herbaspirillum sp. RTI4]|uniref:molybdopterin molybdotransferase MoeA n=1 Tax=Herbaspirillum sp. RTI4 TaxID=3048640 RepID=UPI002AB5BDC5|nr:gephyrin-like molybdotransferase Glp [Herbaspirillum sp. RTI4]MDY7578384.1 molybdopterin molybdotransferase MoeA [Herbaspirillum sp. RTI4]MEA9983075.1 molybdopterin molybdotransferase MoeA [Herbaspirillum sp. RTI4]